MYKKIGVTVLALILLGLMVITASALTANTNKTTYYPGEEVVVTGTATPDTIVTLQMLNPDGDLVTADQVKTASDGSFTITLFKFPTKPTDLVPYGTYTIKVYDPSADKLVTLTIEFSPAKAVIEGTVVDPQGNPVAGALVKLLKDGSLVASTATDDTGAFTLEAEVGTYTLSVEKEGYVTYTTTVEVTAPGETIPLNIKLEPVSLKVEIVEVKHNDKPFLGVVREGETLSVAAKVTFGGEVKADADVVAYIKPPEGATGIGEVSFTLSYDTETGLYVGEITVPSVGVDRKSTLTVKASWQGYTAEHSTEMFILVDYEAQISELTSTVNDLKGSLDELRSTVLDLQMSLGDLSIKLSTLESTVSSLKETVSVLRESISELKFNVEKLSVSFNMLNASVTALSQKLSGLESRVASLEKTLGDLSSKVASLEGRVASLESRVDSLSKSMEEGLSKLASNVQQSINALSEQVTSLGKSLDNMASTMNTNINNLKQTVDAVSSALYATLAVAIIALLLSIIVLVLVFKKIKG